MAESSLHHIALIPDGNRRWAKEKGLPSLEGHRKGFDVIVDLSRAIRRMGISTTSIWGFSTENWKRAKDEVGYLMFLFEQMIDTYLDEAIRDEVHITHIGRKDRLGKNLLKKINIAEERTNKFSKFYLNVALDYGGHDEILRAIEKGRQQRVLEGLTPERFGDLLDTAGQPYPNPDLIIRTSGEMRTSGFMPWQAAYAEYIFLEKYFPDMNEQDITDAIEEFERRQRRFGK